jgi:hypothetical protein
MVMLSSVVVASVYPVEPARKTVALHRCTVCDICVICGVGDGDFVWGVDVARWRRPGADEILLAFLVLATIGFILSWLSHSYSPQNPLSSFLITAFLAWRVSRGGRFSRVILIIASGASCAVVALAVARLWDVAVVAVVIICAAQIALLLSPPVYGRTRPEPIPVRAGDWARLLRRPPMWLLACGLLAGALVTVACLGSMDFVAIPGCRPAGSDACSALVEGYPLRWLTAHQNVPLIFKGALLKDSVQWVLVSTSFLYLGWLWLTAPADPSE